MDLATIVGPPDLQVCSVLDACAVDLNTLLGGTDGRGSHLELEVTLIPGTAGEAPNLVNWQIDYDCMADE